MYQGSYVTVKVHKRARVHHASPANRIRALRRRSQPEWRLPYEGVSQRINLAACQATGRNTAVPVARHRQAPPALDGRSVTSLAAKACLAVDTGVMGGARVDVLFSY